MIIIMKIKLDRNNFFKSTIKPLLMNMLKVGKEMIQNNKE